MPARAGVVMVVAFCIYSDDPGTLERQQVEDVVNRCLAR